MDAHFADAFSNGRHVAGVALPEAVHSNQDLGPRSNIQALEPFTEFIGLLKGRHV
jgi:hypothetical protein